MGHHYVPQAYLRRFESPADPGCIWLHPKSGDEARLVPVKRAAQARGYYDADVERALANEVEGPANPLIDKICRGERLDTAERTILAIYMGCMLKRVPRRRRKIRESYPGVLAKTVAKTRRAIEQAARELVNVSQEQVALRLAEADAVEERLRSEPPPEVVREWRAPWPTLAMVSALAFATWRVLFSSGPQWFATTDNPCFFFEAYGLASPDSEFVFPLSPRAALHGSWQSDSRGQHLLVESSQGQVKEVNRRLASATESIAFYPERAEWLEHILPKKEPYLSRILWPTPDRPDGTFKRQPFCPPAGRRSVS